MELRIDPDFADRIPALTDDEFQQLEANILADGAVINPIIVWNGVVVDGHNRFRILMKHPEIQYTTYEKQFRDRYEALAWICKNQLGRRNLTPDQKKYLIGKQYEAEKAAHGGDRKSEFAKSSSQFGNLIEAEKTCERIAEDNGISKNTVLRAESFAKAVDIAEQVDPGIRTELLNGNIKATAKSIQSLVNADPTERPAIIAELRKPASEKAKQQKDKKTQNRPLSPMQQISNDMLTPRSKGTEADLLYELEDALDSLVFRWTMGIENYQEFLSNGSCQTKINQLAYRGINFLQQRIKGVKSE